MRIRWLEHQPAGRSARSGAPPAAPGGGSSSPTYTPVTRYTLKGGTAARTNSTIVADGTDESGVLVTASGRLTLRDPQITTSGDSRSGEESSFYGLNAGVLANDRGDVRIAGGSVTTSGTGANGIYAYGSGASVSMEGGSIRAAGGGAHGAMTAGGGAVSVTGVHISTAGASAAALATDRGGGTIHVSGGTMSTSGFKSPDIYSTGVIDVSGATMSATGADLSGHYSNPPAPLDALLNEASNAANVACGRGLPSAARAYLGAVGVGLTRAG